MLDELVTRCERVGVHSHERSNPLIAPQTDASSSTMAIFVPVLIIFNSYLMGVIRLSFRMPSLSMRERKVLGLRPSIRAAPFGPSTHHPVCCMTSRMWYRCSSFKVAPRGAGLDGRLASEALENRRRESAQRSGSSSQLPGETTAALSMTFFNSLMFPGQSWRVSNFRTSSEIGSYNRPNRRLASCKNASASNPISSRLSLNGGKVIG